MRRSTSLLRTLIPLLALATAACGDSTGPRLTAEEVAGAYNVCSLVFTPEGGTLPAVNIRETAFELTNASVTPPRLALNPDRSFTLEYTDRGQFSTRIREGSWAPSRQSIQASFANPQTVLAAVLLPARLDLNYTSSPRAFEVAPGQTTYSVARADYARLRGVDQTNLPVTISGNLSGRFVMGGCS